MYAWASLSAFAGLSPRVRGNPSGSIGQMSSKRSIPACAGEPFSIKSSSNRARVYPRVCGGTWITGYRSSDQPGLSPRVRGNPPVQYPKVVAFRSIPACAGEPCHGTGGVSFRTVYPRVCGGTVQGCVVHIVNRGLSPRVRGNPQIRHPALRHFRSIPACAGEPSIDAISGLTGTVYPRVCGGTVSNSPCLGMMVGLSPRVRGNPRTRCSDERLYGSIPACAGEPKTDDKSPDLA